MRKLFNHLSNVRDQIKWISGIIGMFYSTHLNITIVLINSSSPLKRGNARERGNLEQ